MTYHIGAERVSLDELRKRIVETDLIPSRAALLDGITEKMKALEQQGITTLAGLRNELKSPKRLEALSETTGIDTKYLILLRREIEGYFPKPSALEAFDWLPGGEIAKLEGGEYGMPLLCGSGRQHRRPNRACEINRRGRCRSRSTRAVGGPDEGAVGEPDNSQDARRGRL